MTTGTPTPRKEDKLPGQPLTEADFRDVLAVRAIDRAVGVLANLRRISDMEGAALFGRRRVKNCAGILIPYYFPGDPFQRDYRVRLDEPEMEMVNGKPKITCRYRSAPSARPRLYFPPETTLEQLKDVSLPIIITEGELKALALFGLSKRNGEQPLFLPLAVPGVWNWRGTIGKVGNERGVQVPVKGPIPDLNAIKWLGRSTSILFDTNVATNPDVARARKGFAGELAAREAKMHLIDLPASDGVNGIDDYIAKMGADPALRLILDEQHKFESVEGFSVCEEKEDWGVRHLESDGSRSSFVCSPLYVTAVSRDREGRAWGRHLRWKDLDGVSHTWAMPMSLLATDGAEVRQRLLSEGLIIGPNKRANELLLKYLRLARPSRSVHCVSKLGWNGPAEDEHEGFVLPDEIFPPSQVGRTIYQSESISSHDYRTSGSISEWQERVAALAEKNSRVEFAISVAFAAALIGPLGEESGGFHFVSGSSAGKTTTLIVAGSVWGGGGKAGFVKTWDSTKNALEGMALRHNDALLPLDELSQVAAAEAGNIAYQLANGQAKMRSTKTAELREPKRWNLYFLSSGEIGLEDHMRKANQQARGGQLVRLVQIPGDAGKEMGIFEDIHGRPRPAAFAEELKQNAMRFYGTPIRAFLHRVAPNLDDARRYVQRWQLEFLSEVFPPTATVSGEVQRVARRMGFVAAVGELVTRMCITGWARDRAFQAAKTCFESFVDRRGTVGSFDHQAAISHVRKILALHGSSRFQRSSEREEDQDRLRRGEQLGEMGPQELGAIVSQQLGWFKDKEFRILPDVFRAEICNPAGFDYDDVLKALDAEGYLVTLNESGKKRMTIKRSPPGPRVVAIKSSIVYSQGDEDSDDSEVRI
jgi:uncharacterized protein (DUF927 family)